LIIEPDLSKADTNTIINNLYMSAQLGSDSPVDVPVMGYSEIGKSTESAESQKAVSFQTLRDIKENVSTMYWTSREIITAIDPACWKAITDNPEQFICKALPAAVAPATVAPQVTAAFALRTPEIKSISGFLSDPLNVEISRVVGNTLLGLSGSTTASIATQYQSDFDILTTKDKTYGADEMSSAASRLYERNQLITRDFCVAIAAAKAGNCNDVTAVDSFLNKESQRQVAVLRDLRVPGQIILPSAKAQDGQSLLLTVESKAKGGGGSGSKAVFNIVMKNFGTKVSISPTVFFITRVAVNSADLTRKAAQFKGDPAPQSNPITSLGGAPFPGVSFLLTHYHRGLSYGEDPVLAPLVNKDERINFRARSTTSDKFLSGLAPGIGVNTTFMSFTDARDFDVSTNQFTKTSATTFQLGVGPAVSLFNNALQFTYGWNLNVDQRRRYFGIGFGFVEVGKTLAGFVKK
jgi:hypothetical protein